MVCCTVCICLEKTNAAEGVNAPIAAGKAYRCYSPNCLSVRNQEIKPCKGGIVDVTVQLGCFLRQGCNIDTKGNLFLLSISFSSHFYAIKT